MSLMIKPVRCSAEAESGRCYADHRALLSAKLDAPSDDTRIAPEAILPQLVSQDHHLARPLHRVLPGEAPAELGLEAEGIEQCVGRGQHRHLVGVALAIDGTLEVPVGAESVTRPVEH
jgi:hypothetical protein